MYNYYMDKLFDLTEKESVRQRDSLNLIASENYPSPKVLWLLGSIWNDKYAEGYPGKRYYAGNILSDELEQFVQTKALEVFDSTGEYGVNVQVLSGSPANAMVYFTVLEPGDTVLSLELASGGHLSHMHATSSYLKFFKHETYSVVAGPNGYEIDLDDFKHKVETIKPRLVVVGFSAYPRKYEFSEFCKIAHLNGALVLADIAHIAGLVATGLHDSPFKHDGEGADFITTTTHKTLRGPRSALLFAKHQYMEAVNKTVFPGTSGGPHLNQIAAVGQALLEVLGEDEYPDQQSYREYIQAVVANTQALEKGLVENGLEVVAPTQTHLSLVRLPESTDSLELQTRLEKLGIITNRNAVPDDTKSPWRPGGLRLGMAALTSRGIETEQTEELGKTIAAIILDKAKDKETRELIQKVIGQLSWWY
jgi:glycine hydroxymethyltransferase